MLPTNWATGDATTIWITFPKAKGSKNQVGQTAHSMCKLLAKQMSSDVDTDAEDNSECPPPPHYGGLHPRVGLKSGLILFITTYTLYMHC